MCYYVSMFEYVVQFQLMEVLRYINYNFSIQSTLDKRNTHGRRKFVPIIKSFQLWKPKCVQHLGEWNWNVFQIVPISERSNYKVSNYWGSTVSYIRILNYEKMFDTDELCIFSVCLLIKEAKQTNNFCKFFWGIFGVTPRRICKHSGVFLWIFSLNLSCQIQRDFTLMSHVNMIDNLLGENAFPQTHPSLSLKICYPSTCGDE